MSRPRYKSLGAYVAATRISQTELADKLGVSVSAVSLYLRGKRIPQPDIALRIAALGVALESVLTRKAA